MLVVGNILGRKTSDAHGEVYFNEFNSTSPSMEFELDFKPEYVAWVEDGTYGGYSKRSFYVKDMGYDSGSGFVPSPAFTPNTSWIKIEGNKLTVSNYPDDVGTRNVIMAFRA